MFSASEAMAIPPASSMDNRPPSAAVAEVKAAVERTAASRLLLLGERL
jgi:hypothetical protein